MIRIRPMGHRIMEASKRMIEQFRDNKRCNTTKKSEESWTQFCLTQPKKEKEKGKISLR